MMSRSDALHEFAVDVTNEGQILTYTVIATSEIQARDLLVRHFGANTKWERIRARHVEKAPNETGARVVTV